MMQITEDTPPDMLAGAMDLTIHLPNSRTVKMSVERSTPMMDLLVQTTTTHHLQHSGHILQALEMGPSSGPTDKILPYKPNTPIGSLNTQHVKVVPKNRSSSMPRSVTVGHQPFESTFRLQVHLPRNQLYVIRVSQYVYLEDIMKKVCDEKNLDIRKYEFRHPGNLDEVLDPKLTLSDYQITEVYIVAKGTVSLTQAFSSSDIMVLKKEEERKQLQARTGGGVLSLIFKRGKQTIGSGSVSSDNRSISPSHSDDSRSVTPPAIQQQIVPVTQQPSPLTEKPKPPQRKRRPAPKPPQQTNATDSKPSSQISSISDSNTSDLQRKSSENGLTICHSRNSSDSSGYHEPSVLSDNCNLSLPRRPKSNIINEVVSEEVQVAENNRNSGNLSSMVMFSKSTTSITSRKKKAAPPPPPPPTMIVKSESLVENQEKASPVVASPIVETEGKCETSESSIDQQGDGNTGNVTSEEMYIDPSETDLDSVTSQSVASVEDNPAPDAVNEAKTFPNPHPRTKIENKLPRPMPRIKPVVFDNHVPQAQNTKSSATEASSPQFDGIEAINKVFTLTYNNAASTDNSPKEQLSLNSIVDCVNISLVPDIHEDKQAPEIVAVTPKKLSDASLFSNKLLFESVDLIQGNKKRTSLLSLNGTNDGSYRDPELVMSKSAPNLLDDYETTDSTSVSNDSEIIDHQRKLSREQNLECIIRSSGSGPSLMEISNIKRWDNLQDLDDISVTSFNSCFGGNKWVVGDDSDTDSLSTAPTVPSKQSPRESITSKESIASSQYSKTETPVSHVESPQEQVTNLSLQRPPETEIITTSSNIATPIIAEVKPVSVSPNFERTEVNVNEISKQSKEDFSQELPELESEWQYQLPSPPTAFRDCSPTNLTDVTNYDTITLADFKDESVITNPMLFEKLELVKDHRRETDTVSDINSYVSEEEKPMLNKLTLENLEKRKSLVYNRELSTSLKIAQENDSSNSRHEEAASKRSDVILELEEVIQNGGNKSLSRNDSSTNDLQPTHDKHLPNFKISTYDKPKNKINIFEDDSIRSNVETSLRTVPSIDLLNNKDHAPKNSCLVRPLEITSYRRQNSDNSSSEDDGFKKPLEFSKYKALSKSNFYAKHCPATSNSIMRSESFSSNNNNNGNVHHWKPQNPVQRSKSQVALNHYNDNNNFIEDRNDGLSKSNSLFDVSGLHSLEVMRMIQTKLNTPTSSTEQLLEKDVNGAETKVVHNFEILDESKMETISVENEPDSSASITNTKTYKYQGPPAINLSTWSERPKTKVSLKEDTDYRSNGNIITSNINNNHYIRTDNEDSNNVSIKINGSEHITSRDSRNVVIKIGETQSVKSNTFSTRFINHSTAVGYRRPLSNINKIEKSIRPHSISLDSNFDISRVPIVRSVELKKPFKETVQINNKSITQINSHNSEAANNLRNKYIDIKQNTEVGKDTNDVKPDIHNTSIYVGSESFKKPIARVSSFAQNRSSTPNVIGFRGIEIGNDNTARSRKSWNVSNSYNTLPLKISPEPLSNKTSTYIPNSNVPFSQMTLKRVESSKLFTDDNNIISNNNNDVILRDTSVKSNKAANVNRYSMGTPYTINDEFIKIKSAEIKRDVPPPPPPPTMPKITNVRKKVIKAYTPATDPRDDLLNSIRNFGGTKGLRHAKV